MAIPVQTASIGVANNTQLTSATAWASSLTIGNIVVVGISVAGSTNNPSPTVSSVNVGTDSLSLIPGATVTNGSGNTGVHIEFWGGTVKTASQTTLTVNVSTSANIRASGGEYSGVLYSLNQDATPVGNTGNTSPGTLGPIVTTASNDLIFGIFLDSSSSANWGTPTNSYTTEKTGGGAGAGSGAAATGPLAFKYVDLIAASPGSQTSTATCTASINWATLVIALTPPVAASAWNASPTIPRVNSPAFKQRQQATKAASQQLYNRGLLSKTGAPSPQGPTWQQPARVDPKINYRSRQELLVKAASLQLYFINCPKSQGAPSSQGPTYPTPILYASKLMQEANSRRLLLKSAFNLYYSQRPISPAQVSGIYAPQVSKPPKVIRLIPKAAQQLYNTKILSLTPTGYTETAYQSILIKRPPPKLAAKEASALYYRNLPYSQGSPSSQGPTYPEPPHLDVNAARKYRTKLIRVASNYLFHNLFSNTGSPSNVGPTWPQAPKIDVNAARKYRSNLIRKAADILYLQNLIGRTGSPSGIGPTYPESPHLDVAVSRKYRNKLVIKASELLYRQNNPNPQGSPAGVDPTWPQPVQQDIAAGRKYRTKLALKAAQQLYNRNLLSATGAPSPQAPTYPEPPHINLISGRKSRTALLLKASQLLLQRNLLSKTGAPSFQGPTWPQQPQLDVNKSRKYLAKLAKAASNLLFQHDVFSQSGSPSGAGPTYIQSPKLDPSIARKYRQSLVRKSANLLYQQNILSSTVTPNVLAPAYTQTPVVPHRPSRLPIKASQQLYRNTYPVQIASVYAGRLYKNTRQKLLTRAASNLLFQHDLFSNTGSPSSQGPTWNEPAHLDVNKARKYNSRLTKAASNLYFNDRPIYSQAAPTPLPKISVDPKLQLNRNKHLANKAASNLYLQHNIISMTGAPSPQSHTFSQPLAALQHQTLKTIARQQSTRLAIKDAALLLYIAKPYVATGSPSGIGPTYPQPPVVDPKLPFNREKQRLVRIGSLLYYHKGFTFSSAPPIPKICIHIYAPLSNELSLYSSLGIPNTDGEIVQDIYAPLSNELSLYCQFDSPNTDNQTVENIYAPLSNKLIIYCTVGTEC